MRRLRSAVALAFALSAFSQERIEDRCELRSATDARSASIERWLAGRHGSVAAAATAAPIRLRDGIVILREDERNAPFDHPFDLTGRTLRFRRRDATTFSVTNEPLAFESDLGSKQSARSVFAYPLPFSFPFFSQSLRTVYLSPFNAIYSQLPDTNAVDQYGADELAALPAVIAPFLTTASAAGAGADVWVRNAPDRAVITWIQTTPAVTTNIQAVLFASGDVALSYKQVAGIRTGAIVVSAGRQTLQATSSKDASDPEDDVDPRLDVEAVSVSQLGDSGIVELRFTLRAAPGPSGLAATDYLRYDVTVGSSRVTYALFGSGAEDFQVPVWGETLRNPAARLEGRTLTLDIVPEYLGVSAGGDANVEFRTSASTSPAIADVARIAFSFAPAPRALLTRFSTIGTPANVTSFAGEAFTLPVFDPFGAWEQVRGTFGIDEREIDAVAFYQNFTTDIVLYAGAYSTGGNPGVDGISLRRAVSRALPQSPSLLHMNRIGVLKNADVRSATRVLMHEFGHHWLHNVTIRENGFDSRVLNPVSSHPAQYVDTRAAFTVYDADDASVMGGGFFDDFGASFRSTKYSAYGYSWIDLYLMGLASPAEVQPSFYIANSSPELGLAYFPPEQATFRGERRSVAIQQLIDSMGPRVPAYPDTQRDFTVLLVIVEGADALSEEDFARVQSYRDSFVSRFAIATASRARVKTAWKTPRRRTISPR